MVETLISSATTIITAIAATSQLHIAAIKFVTTSITEREEAPTMHFAVS